MSTPHRTYPAALRLAGRLCVVVGGGTVARRKVAGLAGTGARIRIIAPQFHPELLELGGVELCRRPFRSEDLDGATLVFAATDDPAVNAEIVRLAMTRGILVNAADDRVHGGDLLLPAVLRRGALTVAVSSDGGSPALSARLRDEIAAVIGPEWEITCRIVAALRQKELTEANRTAYNSTVVDRLITAGLPALAAAGDAAGIDRLLRQEADGMTLAALGVELEKGRI